MNFIGDVYAASKNFAASSSRIQNNSPFCGCTRAAGKLSLSCKILLTTSALLDPTAANMHFLALFITGRVRVMRHRGGLGESLIGQTHKLVSFKSL